MEDRNNNQRTIQVSVELKGELACAFERYRDSVPFGQNAAAIRALAQRQLEALDFLRGKEKTEQVVTA